MRKNFDIGITTFSLRYDFIENLINKIRNLDITNNIFICVNGEKDSNFNDNYRKNILNLCSCYPNIYPIFFVETRGLAKMWNTLIIHSSNENMLILNDDIEIYNEDIFNTVSQHIESKEYFGITKINNTFSFFIINKELIDEIGYFDERLLGFGEEDGDITYRIIEKLNKDVYNINVGGVRNIVSDIRHDYIKPGVGKYSLFNRKFIFEEKYTSNSPKSNISGMFGAPHDKILTDINLYPYEKFFKKNKKFL